jgi:hypothetical protein
MRTLLATALLLAFADRALGHSRSKPPLRAAAGRLLPRPSSTPNERARRPAQRSGGGAVPGSDFIQVDRDTSLTERGEVLQTSALPLGDGAFTSRH